MRVAITGASGFLGLTLTLAARARTDEVTALYCQHPIAIPGVSCVRLDLEVQNAVGECLQRLRPDWILHCAAATNVDWCQDHPAQARALNVEVSRRLAEAAGQVGARLLYVSTDSVFNGKRGSYTEDDPCDPLNVYAASKLEGEGAVRKALPAALIVRTNLFGWKQAGSPSLAEWIVQELTAQKPVPGFSDVIFTPLLVNDLSAILLEMADRGLTGLYHVAGTPACSKFEFARLVACTFGLRGDLVQSTAVGQATLRAPRPLNTSLHAEKAVAALGRGMPDLPAAVQRMRALGDSGFREQLKRLRKGLSDAKI